MQQPGALASSPPPAPSFAGLLAALAAPAQRSGVPGDGSLSQGWKTAPAWNDDDLADDVATLSYERALRAHARYRSVSPTDQSLTQSADPGPTRALDPSPAAAAATPQPAPHSSANMEPEPNRLRTTQLERNLKCASITIRMSKTECAQLHRRAAEAGLTVSAYLRSCTFEAESLRALVKDTLAQLRSATTVAKPVIPAAPRRAWFQWLARLFAPWHGIQRAVRA